MSPFPRPVFSSRAAAVLSMIGVAVGLGNVWRFPYMMGQYGGSAFLCIYVAFVLLLAIPALSAEWALGRATRKGPIGALREAFGPLSGTAAGGLLMLTVTITVSYYLLVVGQVGFTAFMAVFRGFDAHGIAALKAGLGNGPLQYGVGLGVLYAGLYVVHRGLRRGIEAASILIVPLFGAVIVYLVFHALALPGALEAMAAFLAPDFAALGPAEVFAAMGQAVFSIGLGGTLMLTYGSYLADTERIPRNAVLTCLGDTSAALLASLFLVPAMLVYGLDMSAGPGLLFDTLPELFGRMPAGGLAGSAFLLALALVAFLSAVAALEVIVAGFAATDLPGLRLTRGLVIAGLAVVETALMLPSALDPALIGRLDLIFGSGMQVLGSALAVLALTWGLGRETTLTQIFGGRRDRACLLYVHWLRWAVPGVLLFVLLNYSLTAMLGA